MDFFQKLTKAFWISRPLYWIGPVAAYKAGLCAAGLQTGPFEWLELFLLAFPLSLFIYGLNDIYDIKYDQKNPRKEKPVWGARISEKDIPWLKNWCYISAAALLMAIPVLLLYIVGQKFMVAGLTAGAVKGGG